MSKPAIPRRLPWTLFQNNFWPVKIRAATAIPPSAARTSTIFPANSLFALEAEIVPGAIGWRTPGSAKRIRLLRLLPLSHPEPPNGGQR